VTIPLLDLVAQYRGIQPEIDDAIQGVLARGAFILGPNVEALEREIASYLGVRHAVAVASGTDALILAFHACGVGPGSEVIVPAYTFFATAEAVSHCGATPVFADIDPRTCCLDVADVARRVTVRTKAVVPVHLYGHPVEMGPLLELAGERGVKVIEDNAQAIGAEYLGRKTGSLGDVGCLSFYPTKNLGAYGDGGMIVTDDAALEDIVRKLRSHGWRTKYRPEMLGWNSRLDELQAAILRVKLRHLNTWNDKRRQIALRYRALLSDVDVGLPWEAPYAKHVYHLYVLRTKKRAAVERRLGERGIAFGVYYPLPLHCVEPYRSLGHAPGSFAESERAAEETLAIPLYPELRDAEVGAVASAISEALEA
jgi:dTDP-4-amino-4,6-dideoxygalactose transaminase